MTIAAGSRWPSAVDTTEVVVVRASDDEASLECGGHEMLAAGAQRGGLEVLRIKPGDGSLPLLGPVLQLKAVKPLPSSD